MTENICRIPINDEPTYDNTVEVDPDQAKDDYELYQPMLSEYVRGQISMAHSAINRITMHNIDNDNCPKVHRAMQKIRNCIAEFEDM